MTSQKSAPRKKRRKSISKLYEMCDQLSNRDDQLKRDLRMFEDFFCNFPLPVTMWSIDPDFNLLSKRGNFFSLQDSETIDMMFECDVLKGKFIEKHKIALEGIPVSYFIERNEKLFWAKLVPRRNEDESITGVMGIAWDVTSNSIMLRAFESIIHEVDNGCDKKEIRKEAFHALNVSRLRKLLEKEGS
jgi:hypothetical protein